MDGAARIAHDVQTPIAIILGLCARLEAGDVNRAQAADLERIRAQATAIAVATAPLMRRRPPGEASGPSAAGDGESPSEAPTAVVDAARLAREVADELAVLARERGARIEVDAPRAARVRGDGVRLRAALTNLLVNATRQLAPGGLVRCSVRSAGSQVTIGVGDSGPGVPAADREAVLRFGHQGSGARGNAGLGLSIVSEAATALGGTLSLDAAPEGGALFTLRLPRARSGSLRRGPRRG